MPGPLLKSEYVGELHDPYGLLGFKMYYRRGQASLVAQLVKNPPATQETPVQLLGPEVPLKRGRLPTPVASLVAQMVKNLPSMQKIWAQSLGWADPLEKGMATHSSILTWRIPLTEEPDGLQSMGSQKLDTTKTAQRIGSF